jgi:hypothetical protein
MATNACSQNEKLSSDFKVSTVRQLCELINANYVFLDVGLKTSQQLELKLKAGDFDTIQHAKTFARVLTQIVQSVNHDKHMRIRFIDGNRQRGAPRETGNGFKESKIIEGNIGYLDMRGFAPPAFASTAADEHMKNLESAGAIIIDLRKNGGGNPEMVQYLCSYFFNEQLHLNSLYYRGTNQTTEFWTVNVLGKKRPDVPLFILTSNFTFSAAEEFCYNMQTRKRAILIGETTGGGANPGQEFSINDQLSIFIPTGRAINPVTGTNWEGVGVVPDISTLSMDALDKAIELAKKSITK